MLQLSLAVLGVLAGITLFHEHLLYFPARATVAEMAAGPLRPWPSAQDFRGLVAAPAGTARATALVFHGNAGHAGHRAFYAAALVRLGVRVILAEYPGYGPREGSPGEEALIADAERTIALAYESYGAPLLLVGESLGAAVAAGASARGPERIAGLLLITPWDRLAHLARHHYPWLPADWLLRGRYDSIAALANYAGPVVVVVAARDDIVPARFGTALHAALGGPKQLVSVAGAGHNDWPARVDAAFWHAAIAFLLEPAAR